MLDNVVPSSAMRGHLNHARMTCFPGSPRSIRGCTLVLGHERAGAPRPFEATWRARKSTTSATEIAVSAALCARPGRALLSAGRPKHTNQGTTNRHARAKPLPQLHMRKGVPKPIPASGTGGQRLEFACRRNDSKLGTANSATFPCCMQVAAVREGRSTQTAAGDVRGLRVRARRLPPGGDLRQ